MNKPSYKLIVQPTDNCLELLRYVDQNISSINATGVRVYVEKIGTDEFDEDMVELLRKKGITRLPALITPRGKVFTGLKRIIEFFARGANAIRTDERVGPSKNPTDLSNFYMKELFAGKDKDGKFIPRTDADETEDESADIARRVAEYSTGSNRNKQPTNTTPDYDSEDDNIADDNNTTDAGDADELLSMWMTNNING